MGKEEKEWEAFRSVIKMSVFLPEYAGIEYNSRTRQKLAGRSDRPETDFSEEEWKMINRGLRKLKQRFSRFITG